MMDEDNQYERFLTLFRSDERKIFGHILYMVPNRSIADDLMQETMIVMWRKFSSYTEGTSFSSWGSAISRFVVLEYYRKEKQSIVCFSSEAIDRLQEVSDPLEQHDIRVEALQKCLGKLPKQSRQIIGWRYRENMTIKDIAGKIKKPLQGMYKSISKVHFILQECIENQLAAWGDSYE